MDANTQIAAAASAGFTARVHAASGRVYVKYDGKDAGYLLPSDDGTTGTCGNVTRRAGALAEALRAVR